MARPFAADRNRRLPRSLDDIRALLNAVHWASVRRETRREAGTQIAIVGPVNSGKSTLFNLLQGREVSAVSPVPGTTRALVRDTVGPFLLVDTPGIDEAGGHERSDLARTAIRQVGAVLLLLDAEAGLRSSDVALFRSLERLGTPMVCAINKIDLVGSELRAVVGYVEAQLGWSVVPISAQRGTNVSERLIPALLDLDPAVAIAVGRELPRFRRAAAQRVIRSTAAFTAAVGTEPLPFVDLPFLLGAQARMVLRIAAIYGEPLSTQHARELVAAMTGGVLLRTAAQQAAKLVPFGGWAVAGGLVAAGTWAMGQAAVEYFASGKQLSLEGLRVLYRRFRAQAPPA